MHNPTFTSILTQYNGKSALKNRVRIILVRLRRIFTNSKFKFFRIIAICGACISFYIGAGFATMQEVVQYEASYGSLFWIVIAVCAVLYVYTNISFTTNANRLNLTRGGEIFEVYTSVLAFAFSIIICAGIYSSAVPILWTSVRKVAEEKSMRFTIIAIGGGLIGAMIPIYFDYSWLVNIIYGYLGFLGFALVFFMIIYDIKTKMSKTKINSEN
ncbi:MAG: hypothetical protein MJ080_05740 [Clostridia bacterium]|nr:hypothetical protein [Clostridia bacterium]